MGFGIFANLPQWNHKIRFDGKCPNFNRKILQSVTFSQKSASGFYISNSCILRGNGQKLSFLAFLFADFLDFEQNMVWRKT